ncbi:MAG: 2-oxoacid:acceptor oxidoreductase subunit alpha [Anaerolineae bacterium CG_4_9_14_3_um_filter_57_17]|nr:2-oxoacid:acceptor oxidoreductase subunit alpha [bacterium]NCT21719.1 2-oxoacid:acceptor oxidoreductase subunit alpha [bacterium]OIO84551.1 MAG: ferredoxin oxidoreductase [Anaerolineae bacterium CG2_30_57_67]PJB65538.1 MAG: 2-oxoacid:acceptor oxidoreductase subunit alpha [Anaerolineae bacterium CG_4_9_14_3_um_filter_57_17]
MTDRIVNDFSITVGTVNGSGSSTANNTILRAIFKMGIPVSGKNLFPSNIQGLPTWYTIRVNKDGFTARRDEREIVIAINPASFEKDVASLVPGGVLFYEDSIKAPITREDITVYPMPIKQIVRSDPNVPSNLRDLVGNMVYVGILAQMIGMDLETIRAALTFHFKGKAKPVELNFNAASAGAEWAKANLEKKDPYYLKAMSATNGMIMADGNTAAALGAIYGGVQYVGWYPITPATSLAETLNEYLPKLRKDENGKATYAIIQTEDELAAIGSCVGAGWAGLRAMTSTSGPGLSLMTEFAGMAYFAEVPLVVWDIVRMGPSTGLPTRTSQGDLSFVANMGHGDTDALMLLPGSVNECFQFGWQAFDIAERLQAPVFVMSDLDFGMNQWMTTPFEYPDRPMDRGKVLWEQDLEKSDGKWGRYLDVDGDGIPYRTLPGNRHPASSYFTRGTGHDEYAKYSEEPQVWIRMMARLKKKYETAKQYLPKPVIDGSGSKVGIIAFGSTEPAVREARALLAEKGIQTDFLRLRAIPFAPEVTDFISAHETVYVVEMNRDAQLHQMLTLKHVPQASKLTAIAFNDGLPPTAQWIFNDILAKEEK